MKLETKAVVNFIYRRASYLPDPAKFAKWLRLLRATAYVLMAVERFKKLISKDKRSRRPEKECALSVELISKAERLLLQDVQREHYFLEIETLENKKELPKGSNLRDLSPALKDGLLRVQGRASAVWDIPEFNNNPIILDGRNYIRRLLMHDYHSRLGHANHQTVINELRQKYWITSARATLRTITAKCPLCQVKRSRPLPPRMADLPPGRLAHETNPFSHCGIDYFGPMEVTIRRRREKRWGVLFTCLTTRAIHLEIADRLNTDSAIMALQRMTARRGQPSVIYSDNGTNFRGAAEELKKAVSALNVARLVDNSANNGTKWVFNPPSAPHMGGAWESMVKAVKKALYQAMNSEAPKEEVLRTLFAEAEHTVNSRPLTYVSSDPLDQEAITPNHILFGASSRNLVPRHYELMEGSHKRLWLKAQLMANTFWVRWKKEYLPTLLPRKKWQWENLNLKVGDVVIIMCDTAKRNKWLKGVVEMLHPSRDNRVRSVTVRTATGTLDRPVVKLIKLELASESNAQLGV